MTVNGKMIYHYKFISLFILFVLGALSCKQENDQKLQPNIVFIFIDDMGWKDVGFMGAEYYETPNIDKLAEGGMIFSQAYANAPNCAPTRASLLSGQYSPGMVSLQLPDQIGENPKTGV